MNKTKKRIIIVAIILVILITAPIATFQIVKAATIQNVFDEIYYSEIQTSPISLTNTHIYKMKIWHKTSGDAIYYEGLGSYNVTPLEYKGTDKVDILIDKNEDKLIFGHIMYYGDESSIQTNYIYDPKTRTLTAAPLYVSCFDAPDGEYYYGTYDPEVIQSFIATNNIPDSKLAEDFDFVFNQVIIPSWINDNDGNSRFSVEKIGNYTYIMSTEQTPAFGDSHETRGETGKN